MSAQAKTTESQVSLELNRSPWIVAISGGLLGGAAMGLLMQFWMDAMPAIGALYGQPTLTAGWAAHLVHSILFALLFVAAIRETPINKYATSMQNIIGLGALYGVVLTIRCVRDAAMAKHRCEHGDGSSIVLDSIADRTHRLRCPRRRCVRTCTTDLDFHFFKEWLKRDRFLNERCSAIVRICRFHFNIRTRSIR